MTRFRWFGPETFFFAGLWAVLAVGGRESLFRDPGTFWHVRTGERILDSGRFLDADPYTFTFGGQPWTPYEWLGEVAMALLYRAAGPDGLLVAAAAVIGATFTLPFARLVRGGLHPAPAACLTGLAVAAASPHFHARPHLGTLLLLAITFARIQDYEAGRVGRRGLWLLIPLFVVWCNTHGGVLGGFGTAGLAVAGWVGLRLVGWAAPVRGGRDGAVLCGWLGVLGLTALATPYGLGVPRTWAAIMGMSELPHLIKEHAAVDVREASGWPFFAFGAVYAVVLARVRGPLRVTWLLPVVWFVLGCERVRHAPLFAVTAALALADILPRTAWAARLAARSDWFRPEVIVRRGGWRTMLPGIGVVLVVFLTTAGFWRARPVGERAAAPAGAWARFPRREWPTALVPDLHREAAGMTDIPIFNEYEFGGFLVYFAPEYRPFVDDRCEVFGGPWLAAFAAANAGEPGPAIRAWEREYGKWSLALVRPGSGFDRYYGGNAGWDRIDGCPAGTLYRRRVAAAGRRKN